KGFFTYIYPIKKSTNLHTIFGKMKSLLRYLSLFYFFTALISCGNKKAEQNDSLVFRYNESANIATLDPAFSKSQNIIWACNQLFNGLVQLDDSLKIQPDIAKNWTISEDGKTYQFVLRNDVYFHKHHLFGKDSTRTVKASDFEYSLNRLKDEKIASPGGWILQNVENFQAIND